MGPELLGDREDGRGAALFTEQDVQVGVGGGPLAMCVSSQQEPPSVQGEAGSQEAWEARNGMVGSSAPPLHCRHPHVHSHGELPRLWSRGCRHAAAGAPPSAAPHTLTLSWWERHLALCWSAQTAL